MAAGKFISYLRVSTRRQGVSGLGLEAQRRAVAEYLNGGRWKLIAEFIEVESGKNIDRPQLQEALKACRLQDATLVVAKLDRLARNAHFLLGLQKADVNFVACDMPSANKLTIGIMALVAEEEGRAISERTKAALQSAKARGVKLGKTATANRTRKGTLKGVAASGAVRSANADSRAQDMAVILSEIQSEGAASLRAIARSLNTKGIPAPRQGQWSAVQVQRVIARLNAK